jgi:hypothetical protein
MGLRIMNYRANTIGATLEILPQEKSGTLVTCTLPLRSSPKVSGQGHLRAGKALRSNPDQLPAQAAA